MTSILLRIGLVIALLVGLFFGYQHIIGIGKHEQYLIDQAIIKTMEVEAGKKLLAETNRADSLTKEPQTLKDAQDLKDSNHENTVSALASRLHDAGRLRDPNAIGCGPGSGGPETPATGLASAGAEDGGQTGGLLSKELTGLLNRLLEEADTINIAYASCKADSVGIRLSGISGASAGQGAVGPLPP